jgi:hypothetical protein
VFESVGGVGGGEPVVERVQQGAGVEVAAAGGHDQPLQRREPHCGVDRASCAHRGGRGSGTQVADHESQAIGRMLQQLGRLTGGPGAAESVEPVAADPPAGHPACRHGVGARGGR